jgi:DNA-binding NtrC family response regulator
VNESGGEISVESQIGRGSIFRVRLPLVSPEPAVAENGATLDRARGGHETVLLVEDDAGVRLLTASILRRSGYRVLEARDGREAIRLWANDAVQVDLLLTDVVMPFVNGPELAAHLKERRPGLPVLYASGYTDDVVAYHGVNQDDTGFLQKPFTAARLIQKVRGTLDRNRCGSTPAAVAG